jgi:hypothetical protein
MLILLAYQGIRQFGRPGDVLLRRLVLVTMCLPSLGSLLVALLGSAFLSDIKGITMLGVPLSDITGQTMLMVNFLVVPCWGVVRWKAFKRAFLYLLPWLGLNLCVLTLVFGSLLFPTPDDTPPFYMPLALLGLLSIPFSFAFAMARLRLERRARFILLIPTTVGTLGMTLVQLMMVMRLTIVQFLGLSLIWTPELIFLLIMNVLATVFALVLLLTLLPKRRRKASPSNAGEELVVVPLP